MKTFEDICRMTQNGLKEYMSAYLCTKGYGVISGDGYLYAKGDHPVLLVAHMDTVHKELCKEIVNDNGKISSPQGIGGDDRCGIFMIMNIVKDLRCSVLLTEDEEIGCVGAKKFAKTNYVQNLDVNFMVEFDRRGNNDLVYYSCDNKDFEGFVEEHTGLKKAFGSFTDICALMPVSKIAGVNISCGYYNPHTKDEYVVYDEMIDIIDQAKVLICAKCDAPFEYIPRKFDFYDNRPKQTSMFNKPKKRSAFSDTEEIEMEIVFNDVNHLGEMVESVELIYGNTKASCWFQFFMDHPSVCMDMVIDYSWS